MNLKKYLSTLSAAEKSELAEKCKTSVAYLYQVSVGIRRCSEALAINIEKETKGAVPCEATRPDADWAYIRGSNGKAAS